jgi:hypothetical protein
MTPKTVELVKATARQTRDEATLLAESGIEPGEWRAPEPTADADTSTTGKENIDKENDNDEGKDKGKDASKSLPLLHPDSKAKAAVAAGRELLEQLNRESAAQQKSTTTFDVGLLPIAELFPNAESKAVASPVLPAELAKMGEVAALAAGVSCAKVRWNCHLPLASAPALSCVQPVFAMTCHSLCRHSSNLRLLLATRSQNACMQQPALASLFIWFVPCPWHLRCVLCRSIEAVQIYLAEPMVEAPRLVGARVMLYLNLWTRRVSSSLPATMLS